MVLLESFSVTYTALVVTPLSEKTKIVDAFSATISQIKETPMSERTKIFDTFSPTLANNADVLAYRDPFGLITHKKK
jgi:hypothetical protein